MNASQFMDKQILGLAAAGAASSPPSGGGGGAGGELFDLMGPNPQEDDVVESHDHLHARGGASTADEVMVPSYDFQPIRTAAAPAPAASASAANAWGSLDSNAASPNLKVIIFGYLPADGAAGRSVRHAPSPANQADICSLGLFRSHGS
jgi:L-tryptophan--pyruvate aminotransferase